MCFHDPFALEYTTTFSPPPPSPPVTPLLPPHPWFHICRPPPPTSVAPDRRCVGRGNALDWHRPCSDLPSPAGALGAMSRTLLAWIARA